MSTDYFTIADFILKIIGAIIGFSLTIRGFNITVASWYKQSELNRENEIAKVALKHRLELLENIRNSIKRIHSILTNGKNPPIQKDQVYVAKTIISISEDLYILGTEEEQKTWESIRKDFFDKKTVNEDKFVAFAILIRDNYRRELGL